MPMETNTSVNSKKASPLGRGLRMLPITLIHLRADSDLKDGKFNGQGTLTYANGNKYVREFKEGKSTGQGTAYVANDSNTSSGRLADSKSVGTLADQEKIKMGIHGGVYVIPVRFND